MYVCMCVCVVIECKTTWRLCDIHFSAWMCQKLMWARNFEFGIEGGDKQA
jgi:hypothetical protein